jgi:thiol-disulfide isomerase/thioredoxin
MTTTNCVTIVTVALALAGLGTQAAAERAPLPAFRIGSDAPPLRVMKWVKGSPVEEFQDGQVYVVEFWATWCDPCIRAMPHITEVAKKFDGKVTIIGISILERPEEKTDDGILALVEPFVAEQGDSMGYRVAADGADEVMAETWFRAAGRRGIPSTFIIGKDKKIAWIGHPMAMDKVLDQVIDGTWDVPAALAEQTKTWEREQDLKEAIDPVLAALRAGEYEAVVVAIDAAVAKMPDLENQLRPMKFDALLRTDESAAFAFMKESAKNEVFHKNPTEAYNFWIAMNRHAETMKNPDWEALAEILMQAVERENKQYTMMTALAGVFAKLSKFDQAVAMQKKAIDVATAEAESGERVSVSWLERQTAKLAEYEERLRNVQ